ncbi:MAG: transcriptional repressor LexA [Candidatus Protistobacter heckmanni]|nr:transcriptional repressor LexA [Candidatus Protistobacter heckmanni]
MERLTDRQQQILDLIRDAIAYTGFPPTRAEIAQRLGFASANAAEAHLRALAKKGVIDLAPGVSRGIRLRQEEPKKLTLPSAAIMQLSLPLVGRVAAGQPILATGHIERHYQLDPGIFPSRPDYLLRVKGMSMRDAGILDGDLLVVRKLAEARNGQIVVARIGDEVTVKRLSRQAGRLELLPENPDLEPIVVHPERDEFAIEGIAVGLLRDHEF